MPRHPPRRFTLCSAPGGSFLWSLTVLCELTSVGDTSPNSHTNTNTNTIQHERHSSLPTLTLCLPLVPWKRSIPYVTVGFPKISNSYLTGWYLPAYTLGEQFLHFSWCRPSWFLVFDSWHQGPL